MSVKTNYSQKLQELSRDFVFVQQHSAAVAVALKTLIANNNNPAPKLQNKNIIECKAALSSAEQCRWRSFEQNAKVVQLYAKHLNPGVPDQAVQKAIDTYQPVVISGTLFDAPSQAQCDEMPDFVVEAYDRAEAALKEKVLNLQELADEETDVSKAAHEALVETVALFSGRGLTLSSVALPFLRNYLINKHTPNAINLIDRLAKGEVGFGYQDLQASSSNAAKEALEALEGAVVYLNHQNLDANPANIVKQAKLYLSEKYKANPQVESYSQDESKTIAKTSKKKDPREIEQKRVHNKLLQYCKAASDEFVTKGYWERTDENGKVIGQGADAAAASNGEKKGLILYDYKAVALAMRAIFRDEKNTPEFEQWKKKLTPSGLLASRSQDKFYETHHYINYKNDDEVPSDIRKMICKAYYDYCQLNAVPEENEHAALKVKFDAFVKKLEALEESGNPNNNEITFMREQLAKSPKDDKTYQTMTADLIKGYNRTKFLRIEELLVPDKDGPGFMHKSADLIKEDRSLIVQAYKIFLQQKAKAQGAPNEDDMQEIDDFSALRPKQQPARSKKKELEIDTDSSSDEEDVKVSVKSKSSVESDDGDDAVDLTAFYNKLRQQNHSSKSKSKSKSKRKD